MQQSSAPEVEGNHEAHLVPEHPDSQQIFGHVGNRNVTTKCTAVPRLQIRIVVGLRSSTGMTIDKVSKMKGRKLTSAILCKWQSIRDYHS